MVPVIVLKASRETVQQHPVTKRYYHHPEERSSMDQKDSESVKLGPFRRKGERVHTQTVKSQTRSLKDNTGYQYRYTGVTRPLKGTMFLFIDKGGCQGIVMPQSH